MLFTSMRRWELMIDYGNGHSLFYAGTRQRPELRRLRRNHGQGWACMIITSVVQVSVATIDDQS